jgi:hypothetical protein
MRSKFLAFLLSVVFVLASLTAVAAKGPGPGDSQNGKCTGNPTTRINGCK